MARKDGKHIGNRGRPRKGNKAFSSLLLISISADPHDIDARKRGGRERRRNFITDRFSEKGDKRSEVRDRSK